MKTGKLKGILAVIILGIMFFGYYGSVLAIITGSIGNGRMILRAETGEKIEKYVKVINSNDVSVNIEVFASGDLAEHIEIKDKNFTLAPKEEKNAYFTIDVEKPGTTESNINVKFSPIEGGNGIGLSSTVIVIAGGEDKEEDNIFGAGFDKINLLTGGVIGIENKSSRIALALSLTFFVLVIFIMVLILFYVKKQREVKLKKSMRKR